VASEPTTTIGHPPETPERRTVLEVPLGFALNFVSGRGLLISRDRKLGPLELKTLELEIPNIAFPFDVTGGAERFKTHRCLLRHLAFGLDADGLAMLLRRSNLGPLGFVEIKAAMRDGFVELTGRFAIGEHQADFTFRAALLVRSPEELNVVFYDARVYGWLPVPAGLLPEYLRRGLNLPYFEGARAGAWTVKPIERFLRESLPRNGWKVPDLRRASLVAAEVARGQLVIVAGPEGEPTPRQIQERESPAAAVRAAEGIATYTKAEEALGRGNIAEAYQLFRESLDDERGGPWARERLLQIGAADPELALETRQLAQEVLAQNPQDVQALLALSAIAMRERSWGEATNRYEALAEIARQRKESFDTVAAELAAAGAATPIDPAGALSAYERAAARARDSVTAHRALFELRRAAGDWGGAAQTGERLVKLETEPERKAGIHRDLGHVYRAQLGDLKLARLHFERALRIAPDDPGALEGLAETYAARGEPARAASYLARLAEQAEESGDQSRIVALNLRLGEIWERWLGDTESAQSRYYRVLDVDPRNRTARLRLAKLAEQKGDINRARSLYEDVLAVEEERGDPEAIPDLVAAYTRLARVTLSMEGASAEAIACLERAVELDPKNRAARDELAKVLRERGEWGRLIHLLEETARVSASAEEVRRSRIAAARLEMLQRDDRKAAQRYLEEAVEAQPDDAEALELLVPLLEAEGDLIELIDRLSAAAQATTEPTRRAEYLFRLATAREVLGIDADERRRDLGRALDANPYLLAAAEKLAALAEASKDAVKLAAALDRLAVAARDEATRGDALLRRGVLLSRDLHRDEDALVAMREAVRASPQNLTAWTALSRLAEKLGDLAGARAALEAALAQARRSGGNRAPLHERLAELARASDDANQEGLHLVEAFEAGLRNEVLCDRLVVVLSKQGQRQHAAELLEGWAAKAAPADADALAMRAAEVRRSLGNFDRAVAVYREIVARGGAAARQAALALEKVASERGDWAAVAEALRFQIDVADAAAQPALLFRLLEAQGQAKDDDGAEVTCLRILEHDPFAAVAHRVLARSCEDRGEWETALSHYWTLLSESPREQLERPERRTAFERAAGIMHEVRPDRLAALQELFDREFPEAPPDALGRPLAAMLAAEGQWSTLLRLRQEQLAHAPPERKVTLHREIGDLLHRHLNRGEEAIPHYQEVIANRPNDIEVREALVEVFSALGRFGDLASLLFAISHLVAEPAAALEYGLRSVETYADKVGDDRAATDVLRALCAMVEGGGPDPRLGAALRRFSLWPELAHELEKTVTAAPDPEDASFLELVEITSDKLGDADTAVAWCRRMTEAFPATDTPRRLLVQLLQRFPTAGRRDEALRQWAEAREGSDRAVVLLELSEQYRGEGKEAEALAVLGEAANADPGNEDLLHQLVDRYSARNDWTHAVIWLERQAFSTPAGDAREERLRHLVAVATDFANAPEAAARGLKALAKRSADETRALAHLYAQSGDLEGLEELEGAIDAFDRDAALNASRGLLAKGRLDGAKRFLDRALDLGATIEAWDLATTAWRAADRLAELGGWRLERAATAKAEDQRWLRLLARAELIESGEVVPDRGEDLEGELAATDLRQPAAAWAVFCVAQSIKSEAWSDRAAAALTKLLAQGDARLPAVLRYRARRELSAGRAEAAATIARRLVAGGDRAAEELLDEALTTAGATDELLQLLTLRAERGGPVAAALWLRLAVLQSQRGDWTAVATAARRVDDAARTLPWAELGYRAGEELGDADLRAECAATAARMSPESTARALWLRRQARALWWHLGRESEAKDLLGEAHLLSPDDPEAILNAAQMDLDEGDREGALQQLEEGLAVLEGPPTAPLWILRAEIQASAEALAQTIDSLVRASELLGDEPLWWRRLGELSLRVGETDMALQALGRAFALDVAHEQPYVAALEKTEKWQEVIDLLEQRADTLTGEDVGIRMAKAARIAKDRLGDSEKALAYSQRAARTAPTLDNLRYTFDLAAAQEKPTLIAALAPALLKRMPVEDSDRDRVLHAHVAALDHLQLGHEALDALKELRQRDRATTREKRQLAELLTDSDPVAAATLFEELARAERGTALGEGLLAAARTWQRAGDDGAARGLLLEALGGGLDTVEAHRLGSQLLEGEERLASMARLIALDGDAEAEPAARAQLRLDVAAWRLREGDAAQAWRLLQDGRGFGKPPGWLAAAEQSLHKLKRFKELATLWAEEVEASELSAEAKVQRLRQASDIYHEVADVLGELKVLQLLARLLPEEKSIQDRLVGVAAELGDADQFQAHVQRELAAADMPDQRAALVQRYAPILIDRFNDAAAAVKLLLPSFTEVPSIALAEALAKAHLAAGQAPQAIKVLVQQAGVTKGEERIPLLAQAAVIARDQTRDAETAFHLFREVVNADAANTEARDFCLTWALEHESWAEAIAILEHAATAAAEPALAFPHLMRAADLARDELGQPERELALLKSAVDALPNDGAAVTRLMEGLVTAKDTDGALGLLLGGHVAEEREYALGIGLLQQLAAQRRRDDANQVMEFLASRHPESAVAAEVRLRKARAAGDHATVLAEVERRLAQSEGLTGAERLALEAEAGHAALALGQEPLALRHLIESLAGESADIDDLTTAASLALRLRDTERLRAVVNFAVPVRQALAAQAETAEPQTRLEMLVLLGAAHETAGDLDGAMRALETALNATVEGASPAVIDGLMRIYEKRGDWQRSVRLLNHQITQTRDEARRAELYYRMGVIWLEHLTDEERAGDCFAQSLRSVPSFAPAQLAYGLMLYRRNQFEEALPLLLAQVRAEERATPIEHATALFECLRQTRQLDAALKVARSILDRDPARHELIAARAEMLEAAGHDADAEVEWAAYLDAVGINASAELTVQVRRKLAALALKRSDVVAAATQLEQARRKAPDSLAVIVELRQLYETTGRWAEAVELRQREAIAASDGPTRAQQYKALATIFLSRLNAPDKAAAMLEKAAEATPDDVVLLKQIMTLHEERQDWRQLLVIGERLLALGEAAGLDAAFYVLLARAYHEAAGDTDRAKEFYERAVAAEPDNANLLAAYATFVRELGDMAAYVKVEESAIALVADVDEKVGRYQELAEICLQQLGDLAKATAALFKARELRPDDVDLLRTLANTCALDASFYGQAIELYREVLVHQPLDTQTLRILARLLGQQGDNDRAYGFYAALLALTPADDEARKFVNACRPAVPPGPQRPVADADRIQGLVHPDQAGPLEDLFAPLARFAELTHPGDLAALGVSERDQLAPTDSRMQYLRKVIDPLPLAKVSLYLWRGGGFTVRTELVGQPAILIGSTLATDASDRQRAFLVTRAGEMYRTGHTLCEKVTAPELAGVAAALCLAVDPRCSPPNGTGETPLWANTIAAPMTEAIRQSLKPRVEAFLAATAAGSEQVDVNRWRWAAQFSAGRVALLLTCDVEDAISALLRFRGMDDLTDEQRLAVIQESPEALDLLRFACSEGFFKLRQALGLALRRSK
jgi:tetratricopeptide (TPR) repeat protein